MVLTTASLDAVGLGLVLPILPALLGQVGSAASTIPMHVGVLLQSWGSRKTGVE